MHVCLCTFLCLFIFTTLCVRNYLFKNVWLQKLLCVTQWLAEYRAACTEASKQEVVQCVDTGCRMSQPASSSAAGTIEDKFMVESCFVQNNSVWPFRLLSVSAQTNHSPASTSANGEAPWTKWKSVPISFNCIQEGAEKVIQSRSCMHFHCNKHSCHGALCSSTSNVSLYVKGIILQMNPIPACTLFLSKVRKPHVKKKQEQIQNWHL